MLVYQIHPKEIMEESTVTSVKIELQALKIIEKNFYKSGNPLGIKTKSSAEILGISRNECRTILYTGQSYQLMPYVLRILSIIDKFGKLEKLANLFSNLNFSKLIIPKMENRFYSAIRGAANALKNAKIDFGVLLNEPYDGSLYYDLGMDHIVDENEKIIRSEFEKNKVERIITISPHSCYMLKKIYSLDVEVIHIYELISNIKCNKKAVIHDPCILARKLGIVTQLRIFNAVEPENTGKNTLCCGGPIEILFPQLSLQIAKSRGNELISTGLNKIATACSICLMNFLRAGFDARDILSFFSGDANED